MSGTKTFDEWVRIYEERDQSKYVLSVGEHVVFDPDHGFFTYVFDPHSKEILIPKMCGNGKHWRKLILKMVKQSQHLGVKGVLCCTKRNPNVYMRVLGGELQKMEHVYNFKTGQTTVFWYIFVSLKNTHVRGDENGEQKQYNNS